MRFASPARIVAGFALFTTLAGIPACTQSAAPANMPLIPAVASPIADVPIPAGFSMTGESTSKVESSGLRFVDHKYVGRDDLLPVVRFYKDQMPGKGWTFVDQNQLVNNEIRLHFTKNSEDCIITVTPGGFHAHVRVQIDPAGRNTPH